MDIPPPIEVDGIPEFAVQTIWDSRIRRRTLQYFVDWVGYDESDRSWERADAVSNATEAVAAFHKKKSKQTSLTRRLLLTGDPVRIHSLFSFTFLLESVLHLR